MQKLKGLIGTAIVASAILLTGCEEKIDASSPKVLEASIKQVSEKLKPVEKVKFDEALKTVVEYNLITYGQNGSTSNAAENSISNMLSGKTVSDIIDMAPGLNEKINLANIEKQKKDIIVAQQIEKQNLDLQKQRRVEQLKLMIANGEQEIAKIEDDARDAIPQLESLEIERKPYSDAVYADQNGLFKVENIKIQATDGNRGKDRLVSMDFVNDSNFAINKIEFNIEYFLNESNRIARKMQEINFETPLSPKGSYHFELNYTSPGLTISKYSPEEVLVKVHFTLIQNTETGINVSSDINKTGWQKESQYIQLKQIIENKETLINAKQAAIKSFADELESLNP